MTLTLQAPSYAKRVTAPPSKSAVHRALITAAFADKPTSLTLPSTACEDIDATVRCLVALGVKITTDNGTLTVKPVARRDVIKGATLDCGESGSTLRFLLPVCAAIGANATFLRRGRLPERPLSLLVEELEAHGFHAREDGAYLHTVGGIAAGDYKIAANISSQYVTGLLLALSLLDAPSTLTLTGKVESAPYIKMTEDTLGAFGAAPEIHENTYRLGGYTENPLRSPLTLTPEGDFSGAAFPMALGAIGTHPVTVTGLSLTSAQGDRAILHLLARFGADIAYHGNEITVSPRPLSGIDIDATDIPDLVPVLAVVGAAASGQTRITGASRLRLKESDRIASTAAFLKALGADITEQDDGFLIRGGKPLHGGTIDVCGDHRIAMSAAVASLLTSEAVVIPDAECTNKSYPTFFDDVIHVKKEK